MSVSQSRSAAARPADDGAAARRFIAGLEARIRLHRPPGYLSLDAHERERADASSLGVLSRVDQRKLVAIARRGREIVDELGERGRIVDDPLGARAAELVILTNYGFVEHLINTHGGGRMEDEVFRQECRLAISESIERYDPDNGASFLAYCEWRMRGAISEAVRSDSRLVRLKSRASEIASRSQRAIKLWEAQASLEDLERAFPNLRSPEQQADEDKAAFAVREATSLRRRQSVDALAGAGQRWTPQLIADITGDRLERVEELLPWVTARYLRLDSPYYREQNAVYHETARPYQRDMFPEVPDPQDVEGEVVEIFTAELLRAGVRALSPYHRRLVELRYGIAADEPGETEVAELATLVDGVFVDKGGRRMSPEPSVVASRRTLGAFEAPVEYLPPAQLRPQIEEGALLFEPGSDAARELYDLAGVAPTSQALEAALEHCFTELAARLESLRPDLLYRGPNALENSAAAAQAVRRELKLAAAAAGGVLEVNGERLTVDKIERLRPGKMAKDGIGRKGQLRKVAEATGHVDPLSGQLNFVPNPVLAAKVTAPPVAATNAGSGTVRPRIGATKIRPVDLLRSGLLQTDERLSLLYKDREYGAYLLADGRIRLDEEQGRTFTALSAAAEAAKGVQADPGWNSWAVVRDGQRLSLFELRKKMLEFMPGAEVTPETEQRPRLSGLAALPVPSPADSPSLEL